MTRAEQGSRSVVPALGPSAFLTAFGAAIVNASDANQLGAFLIVSGVILLLVVAAAIRTKPSQNAQKWLRRFVAMCAWLGVLVGCIGLWVATLPSDYF